MARRRTSEKQAAQERPQHTEPSEDTLAIPRVAQALRLRRLGYTYAEIAQRCQYRDESGARKAINKANARVIRDDARALIVWQLDQIDMALVTVMTKIERGDLWAVDRLVPLLKRQAELLNLDAKDNAATAQAYEKRIVLMIADGHSLDDVPASASAVVESEAQP